MRSKPRILIALSSVGLGGAERQGLMFAEYLKCKHSFDVLVSTFGGEGKVSLLCKETGIQHVNIAYPLLGHRWEVWWKLISTALTLRKIKPDCIVSYCMPANAACAAVWRLTGARACIWGQRDAGLQKELLTPIPLAPRLATCFVSNSPHGAAFLENQLAIPRHKISTIPNAVKLNVAQLSRTEWRSRLKISHDAMIVTMVSNLSFRKDHETLLKAWRIGLDNQLFPQNTKLVLCGRDDSNAPVIRKLAGKLHLDNHIRFAGATDDVAGILNASDIAAFSFISEGLPNVVIESMAAGLPVVATDIPGVRAAIGSCDDNILVPPKDPAAMAHGIAKILQDPALRSRAAAANITQATSTFAPDVVFSAFAKLILSNI
ncbi:glycosyl transferase group 1 [Oleidesulfovibrio alaskensis G20]|uniref:Glycosyl transferase group 1 n=1 Tax=Oleidesulfovibrio alaskensis (strain ATCC BAA-1058 / DSM 17464 / G20) TaxID=207559 RepID=Q30XB1_OLEA2|nr:glycosyl transferase group 1 [Oleidesulfovibrio alaskensis G20]